MSDSTLRFSGSGGMPVDEFLRNVTMRASTEGKQFDDSWNLNFVTARLAGPALKWYEGLDKETKGNWNKLRKALEEKFDTSPPSPKKKSFWKRSVGSIRTPSRSNSLAESLDIQVVSSPTTETAPPPYEAATAGARAPQSPTSSRIVAGPSSAPRNEAARRIRLVSKESRKGLGYISRFPTPEKFFVYTTDDLDALQVVMGSGNVLEIQNGPPVSQLPSALTMGWPEGRDPPKGSDNYAVFSYYEKEFGGFLQARGGWVPSWQTGPSSSVKPLQKKAIGFGTNAFTASIGEGTNLIRLHGDLKAYKRKDPKAIEVELILEPLP